MYFLGFEVFSTVTTYSTIPWVIRMCSLAEFTDLCLSSISCMDYALTLMMNEIRPLNVSRLTPNYMALQYIRTYSSGLLGAKTNIHLENIKFCYQKL
jgi:hypothetical protein